MFCPILFFGDSYAHVNMLDRKESKQGTYETIQKTEKEVRKTNVLRNKR